MGAALVYTDRRTDMTKLIGFFATVRTRLKTHILLEDLHNFFGEHFERISLHTCRN